MPFSFTTLDGKHLTGPKGTGEIVNISTTGAVVRITPRVEELSNMKIRLLGTAAKSGVDGDLYAKVIEYKSSDLARVLFTAVPSDVAELIEQVVDDLRHSGRT